MSVIVPFEGGDPGTSLFFARRSGGAVHPTSFRPPMPFRDLRFSARRDRSLQRQTTRLPSHRSRICPDQLAYGSARCLSSHPLPSPDVSHYFIQPPESQTRRSMEDSPSLSSWRSGMEAEVWGDILTLESLWVPTASLGDAHYSSNPLIRGPRDGGLHDSPGYRGRKQTVPPPACGESSPMSRGEKEVAQLDWLSCCRAPKDCLAASAWRDDYDYLDELSRTIDMSRQVRWI